jgi:predicted TIM-barrel fold metal-dependent hydrolase
MPIIDAHVHIFPEEVKKQRSVFCQAEPAFSLLYHDPQSKIIAAKELIDIMDQDGISQAVVCGFSWKDAGRARMHNEYILDAAERHPDRLIPLACVDPTSPNSLAEIERALTTAVSGIGEIGFYHDDFNSPQVHSALTKLANLATEAGRPLLLHTNEPVGHAYPGKSPMTLKSLYQIIKACPQTKFQLAHLGGGLFFYELMKRKVKETLANCVFDIAAAPYLYQPRIYSLFAELFGEERLLYGSDSPLLRYPRYQKEIQDAGWDKDLEERFFYQNASNFWGLK